MILGPIAIGIGYATGKKWLMVAGGVYAAGSLILGLMAMQQQRELLAAGAARA